MSNKSKGKNAHLFFSPKRIRSWRAMAMTIKNILEFENMKPSYICLPWWLKHWSLKSFIGLQKDGVWLPSPWIWPVLPTLTHKMQWRHLRLQYERQHSFYLTLSLGIQTPCRKGRPGCMERPLLQPCALTIAQLRSQETASLNLKTCVKKPLSLPQPPLLQT